METFTVVVVSARRVGLRDLKRGGRGTSVSVVSGGGVGDLDVCVTVGDTGVEELVCMRTGEECDRCMEIIVQS
jgi:hypothetical protein